MAINPSADFSEAMDWFFHPIFKIFDKPISPAGIASFAAAVLIGFALSALIQSEKVRRFASRLGIDKNVVNIVTGIAGLVVLLSCGLVGLSLAGLPVEWDK